METSHPVTGVKLESDLVCMLKCDIEWVYSLSLEFTPAFCVHAISTTTEITEIKRVPPSNLTEV